MNRILATCSLLVLLASPHPSAAQQRIDNPDPNGRGDWGGGFGIALAVEGQTLVVTAPFWTNAVGEVDGRVYVYEWTSGAWQLTKTLQSPVSDGSLGSSPRLSNDLLAVSHRSLENPLLPVLLFGRNHGGPNNWGLLRSLDAPPGAEVWNFGRTALASDVLAVGFYASDACFIQIFAKDQGGLGNWGAARTLGPMQCDVSPSIALDRNTLVVARGRAAAASGPVLVFERNSGGLENWGQVQQIDPPAGTPWFGTEVALEGSTLAVVGWASLAEGPRIFVYRDDPSDGVPLWVQVANVPPVEGFHWSKGNPVALSGDQLLIGRPDGGQVACFGCLPEGAVDRFGRDVGGPGNWGIVETVLHPEPGTGTSQTFLRDSEFGSAVAAEGEARVIGDFRFVRDLGAGPIYTGAVWAYGQPGALQLADFFPDFLRNGSVTTDPNVLALGGASRWGAAADGTTRLLLRFLAPGPGVVQFSLIGVAGEDGGLDLVGGAQRHSTVTPAAVSTQVGWRALASYRVPDEFDRGDDGALSERPITVQATFSPSSGGNPIVSSAVLRLVRPPVVFMHGLWSSAETWTFPAVGDPRYVVVAVGDYGGPNGTAAARFETNRYEPWWATRSALARMRVRGIAATQVDYVAHSMGGLLGRIWANDPAFLRAENLNRGDFRKLISLDSPHWGSPLGNFLVSIRDSTPSGGLLAAALRQVGLPIDEGAIDDIATGSTALNSIDECSVPAHALVGVGGSDALATSPGLLGALYKSVAFFATVSGDELFQGLQHDYAVGRASQEGGLQASSWTVFGLPDGIHTSNTQSELYSNRISELLDTPVGTGEFGILPAVDTQLSPPFSRTGTPTGVTPGLTITSPPSGTVVAPGQSITVTVEPLGGTAVESVLLVSPGVANTDAVPPFVFIFDVPNESVGSYSLTAAGSNATGEYFSSNTVELTVEPTAALESLVIRPSEPTLVGTQGTLLLQVLGHYGDGVTRDVTSRSSFQSANPSIVSVSPEGRLIANGVGASTVNAIVSGIEGSVRVLVSAEAFALLVDGFESGNLDAWVGTAP